MVLSLNGNASTDLAAILFLSLLFQAELYQIAQTLGGVVEGNLTESTTHLIALSPGSQKYDCALRLGLYILRPDFLFELHSRWQDAAQDLGVDDLLSRHSLRILEGCRVGLCGIVEKSVKQRLRSTLAHMGAHVVVPMTFDTQVTHLLCGTSDRNESSTLDYVYKLRKGHLGTAAERKGGSDLKCVRLEWLDDCKRVGGMVEADQYDIWEHKKPLTQAERAAIVTEYPLRSPDALRKRFAERLQALDEAAQKEARQREEARAAQAAKSSRSNGLKALGSAHDDSKGSKFTSGTQVPESMPSDPHAGSFLNKHRDVIEANEAGPSKPRTRQESTPLTDQGQSLHEAKEVTAEQVQSASEGKVFSGVTIRLALAKKDWSRTPLIRAACVGAGATVIDTKDADSAADYCLVSEAEALRTSAPADKSGERVTYFWLDQCLFYERIVDPSAAPYLRPADLALPCEEAKVCCVGLTGFAVDDSTPDRQQLTKVLELLGCTVTETFGRRRNTHLLSIHSDEIRSLNLSQAAMEERGWLKEARARVWGIPIVGIDWVGRVWRDGVVDPPPSMPPTKAVSTPVTSSNQPAAISGQTGGEQSLAETQGGVPQLGHGVEQVVTPVVETEAAAAPATLSQSRQETNRSIGHDITNRTPPQQQTEVDERQSAGPQQDVGASEEQAQKPSAAPAAAAATATQGEQSLYVERMVRGMVKDVQHLMAGVKRASSSDSARKPDAASTEHANATEGDVNAARSGTRSGSASAIGTSNVSRQHSKKLPPKSRRSGSGALGGSHGVSRSGSVVSREDSKSPSKAGVHGDDASGADDANGEGPTADSLPDAAKVLAQSREAEEARQREAAAATALRSSAQGRENSAGGSSMMAVGPLGTQGVAGGPSSLMFGSHAYDEGDVESSMRVHYIDPQSEKERKRLQEMMMRSRRASGLEDLPESETMEESAAEAPAVEVATTGKRPLAAVDQGSGEDESTAVGPLPKKSRDQAKGRPQARKQPGTAG